MIGVLRIAGMLALFGIDWLCQTLMRVYMYAMIFLLVLSLLIFKDAV